MSYDLTTLRKIYDHSNGNCHICGHKTYWKNYGVQSARGAWEVEHSHPQAHGGTDHLNNLFPAHIHCNREKGTKTTATARSRYGRTKAPLSKKGIEKKRETNTLTGMTSGALIGLRFGLVGVLVGGVVGAVVGYNIETKEK